MKSKLSVAITLSLVGFGGSASAYSLAPYERIITTASADSVAIGDLDGDGQNELAIFAGYSFDSTVRSHLYIYRYSESVDDFVLVDDVALPDVITSSGTMVAANIDVDPQPELVVGILGTVSAVDWDGSAFVVRTTQLPVEMQVLTAVDLDGDGIDEVIGQSFSQGAVLLSARPDGALELVRSIPSLAGGRNDAAAGDLNSDGLADWVVMSGQGYAIPHVQIFYGDGLGDFLPATRSWTPMR